MLARPSQQHGEVFQIRWRINGGGARYETIGPDRRAAEEALALRLAEVNRGTYRERREASFHEFASSWFVDHRTRLRPSAAERMRNGLEVHLLPFFGDYSVDQIGAELIERYVAAKVEERRAGDVRVAALEAELATAEETGTGTRGARRRLAAAKRERGLAPVSVNKSVMLLRQVLQAAVRYGYLDRNPADDVRRLKVAKKARPFLQLDQVEPLIEATAERHRTLVLTLLLAGLRIGEALALRWSDVDLLADPPRIDVARNWDPTTKADGAERRGIEGPVKTGEEGCVDIGRRLLAVLLDHKAGSAYSSDSDLVFPTSTGRHQNPSNVRRRILAPAVARANEVLATSDRPPIADGITPHSLRHTYCSLLIAQGEDLPTVAAQMRHADPSTTLRIYTHVMRHRRNGVAERLDEALAGAVVGRNEVANGASDGGGLAQAPKKPLV